MKTVYNEQIMKSYKASMIVFPKVESIPWLGYRGTVHFYQFVGALAGNLDNAIRALPVRHELLLLTLE